MEDLKISKELFNEVTNSKCHEVFIKNEFIIAHSNLGMKMVNIYEFVFINCKKWAYTKCNYTLESTSNPFGGFCKIEIYEIDIGKAYNKPDDVYRGTNEAEAIIKACEWILENKDNK